LPPSPRGVEGGGIAWARNPWELRQVFCFRASEREAKRNSYLSPISDERNQCLATKKDVENLLGGTDGKWGGSTKDREDSGRSTGRGGRRSEDRERGSLPGVFSAQPPTSALLALPPRALPTSPSFSSLRLPLLPALPSACRESRETSAPPGQ